MANYERGVYEPSDEVRVFDGSEEEEDVEGSRLPLMIVLVLLVLAMFGGMIWVAYSQGVARGRGETPVLTAANGPEKIAPSQPGGANVPYQGFKIYEQPAPPDDSGDAPATNTALPAAAPKPAPVAAAPVEAPKPAPQAIVAATPAPKPTPVTVVPKPEPKPAPPALKPTMAAAPAPKSAATPAPKTMDALIRQAENLPATKTAPAPAAAAPASGAPRQLGAPVPATPKPVAAATGSAVLQIGAYKSQADADTAWKAYKAKHPSAAGYSEDVARVDLGAKGTWYRLRIAGFADKDAATAACTKLKADGGDCMLAK